MTSDIRNTHAIAYWVDENRISVVPVTKIPANGLNLEELVGKTFSLKVSKNFFNAEIKAVGTLKEMEDEAPFWEAWAADNSFNAGDFETESGRPPSPKKSKKSKKKKSRQSETQDEPFVEVTGDDNGLGKENTTEMEGGRKEKDGGELEIVIEELEAGHERSVLLLEIAELKAKVLREKAKNKELRRRLKRTVGAPDADDGGTVDIGGLQISKRFDDYLKLGFSENPSQFLRKLVFESGLFSLEELANSSVTGTRTIHSPTTTRPAIDPIKFKIVKDYTKLSCNLAPKTVAMLVFESRIRSICTDARKKLKRNANN